MGVSGHGASSVQLRCVKHASRPSPRCLASLSIGCGRIYRCRSELDKHNCVERAVRCAGRRVLQRSIANLQATCWPAFPCPTPRRACEAFAFAQILSNPIAGLAPRFGPSSKQLQHSMDQPGEAFGRFSVTAQATPKVLAHIVLSSSTGPTRPNECTNSWTQLTGNPCYPCIYRCSFRPNATVCDVLRPRTGPSHWPAHLSRRGTDDDVSHDCACLNSSDSEW